MQEATASVQQLLEAKRQLLASGFFGTTPAVQERNFSDVLIYSAMLAVPAFAVVLRELIENILAINLNWENIRKKRLIFYR